MKTLDEIRKEIEKNDEQIKELEQKREDVLKEETALRDEWLNGSKDAELLDRIKAKQNAVQMLDKHIENREGVGRLIYNNYRYVYAASLAEILVEVLNEYTGKRAGEKTLDAIKNRVFEKSGFYCYFISEFLSSESKIVDFRSWEIKPSDVRLVIKNGCFIDKENKIQAITAENISPYVLHYIDNPCNTFFDIQDAAGDLQKLADEYNKAAKEYNKLIEGLNGFKSCNYIFCGV